MTADLLSCVRSEDLVGEDLEEEVPEEEVAGHLVVAVVAAVDCCHYFVEWVGFLEAGRPSSGGVVNGCATAEGDEEEP